MADVGSRPAAPIRRPFDVGSVSLGLHPMTALCAREQVMALERHAGTAERAGFDGVTMSEHHNGFPGNLPQPLLAATWLLEHTVAVFAGPLPMLLSVRDPVLLAEEAGGTNAGFPGRLAVALAPGYAASDFQALGGSPDDRFVRFSRSLECLVVALSTEGPMGADPAVRALARRPRAPSERGQQQTGGGASRPVRFRRGLPGRRRRGADRRADRAPP